VTGWRSLATWTIDQATVGGNQIKMPDGSFSNQNGLMAIDTPLSIKKILHNTSSSPANNANLELIAYLRPGHDQFAWMQLRDSNGVSYQMFFDLFNVSLGAAGGTGGGTGEVWSVEKAAHGFVKAKLLVTNSATGSTLNNINIRSADSITVISTGSHPRTNDEFPVSIFVDRWNKRASYLIT